MARVSHPTVSDSSAVQSASARPMRGKRNRGEWPTLRAHLSLARVNGPLVEQADAVGEDGPSKRDLSPDTGISFPFYFSFYFPFSFLLDFQIQI